MQLPCFLNAWEAGLSFNLLESVCYSGFSLNEMPETRRALAEHIGGFSAADYFTMQFQIGEVCDRLSVQTLLSCVNLSRWDPHLFKNYTAPFMTNLKRLIKPRQTTYVLTLKKLRIISISFPMRTILSLISLYFFTH